MAWGNARSRANASSLSSSSSQFRGRNWASSNKHGDDGGGSHSKLKGLKSHGGGSESNAVQFLFRSKALPLWFAIVCCIGLVLYVRPQISSVSSSSYVHYRDDNTAYNYHSEREHEVDLRRAVTKNNKKEEEEEEEEEELGESSKTVSYTHLTLPTTPYV